MRAMQSVTIINVMQCLNDGDRDGPRNVGGFDEMTRPIAEEDSVNR
jgi:hypothetical protein